MHIRSSRLPIVAVVCALTTSLAASAPQAGSGGGAIPAPTAPNAAERAAMNEFAALSLMNETIGEMVPQAKHRTALLSRYVKEKGLDSEFSSYTPPEFHAGATFQQAYGEALKGIAPDAPMAGDADTIAREAAAQMTLVQGAWNDLQAARKTNFNMTSFLRSKDLFDDYHTWAVQASADMAAKAKADHEARMAKAKADEQAAAAKRAAAAQDLQQRLDKLPYSTGIDYDYHFSQGTEATSGDFPRGNGSYSNDSYWSGSYYNGYADPYYDVWGVPGAVGVDGWRAYWRGHGRGTGAYHHAGGARVGGRR